MYEFSNLLPGTYQVAVEHSIEQASVEIRLEAGSELSNVDLDAELNDAMRALLRTVEVYQGLDGYADTTTVEIYEERKDFRMGHTFTADFLLQRPNRLRVEVSAPGLGEALLVNDGTMLTKYWDAEWASLQKRYVQQEAPEVVSNADLAGPMWPFVGIVTGMLVSQDPLAEQIGGITDLKQVGGDSVDGYPVTVVEFSKPAGDLEHSLFRRNQVIRVRMEIGEEDGLIRRVIFIPDLVHTMGRLSEKQRKGLPERRIITEHHRSIETNPARGDDFFKFEPPYGARLVADLNPRSNERTRPVSVGSAAPNFVLSDLDGNTVSLADFAGKVLIVDFWATWCSPCKEAMPTFKALQARYESIDFNVVGIAVRDRADRVKSFAKRQGLNYPVLIAEDEEKEAKVREDYGHISALPTTFVVDKKGIVRFNYVGPPDDMLVFQRNVRQLLAE